MGQVVRSTHHKEGRKRSAAILDRVLEKDHSAWVTLEQRPEGVRG